MRKRIISLLLVAMMMINLLPTNILAVAGNTDGYVAKIGETGYMSLSAAINAAGNDETTITLVSDVTENVTVAAGQSITLALGGHTVNGGTAAAQAAITNNGTLNITGEGTVKREDTAASGTGYYVIENNGTMEIEKATVTNASGISDGWSGSSLICNGNTATASLTVQGGSYTNGKFIAIKNDDYGTLVINGGTFLVGTAAEGYTASAVQNWNTATINDGVFNGAVWTASWKTDVEVSTTITGGTVNGAIIASAYSDTAKPVSVALNGGTYNGAIDLRDANATVTKAANVTINTPAGYAWVENRLVASDAVADVNGTGYATLEEAIAKASSGDTVTLLADTALSEMIRITADITLNLNGKTLSQNGDFVGGLLVIGNKNGNIRTAVTVTGNGTIKTNKAYPLNVSYGDLTVVNGTYDGHTSAIQLGDGTLTIQGGTFKISSYDTDEEYKYVINILDKYNTTSVVSIKGGTFESFNPGNNAAEGAGTNFLATGYEAKETEAGSGIYTVSKIEAKDTDVVVGGLVVGETVNTETLTGAITDAITNAGSAETPTDTVVVQVPKTEVTTDNTTGAANITTYVQAVAEATKNSTQTATKVDLTIPVVTKKAEGENAAEIVTVTLDQSIAKAVANTTEDVTLKVVETDSTTEKVYQIELYVGSAEKTDLGGTATVSLPNHTGEARKMDVYYSEDNGATWKKHGTVQATEEQVTFTTNHLTLWKTVKADPAVWDGTGVDTDWYNDTGTEFEITTAAQLAGLAQLVNSGKNFSGKIVKLGADIDLNNQEWTPIGTSSNRFAGTFDGRNNTISNLKIVNTATGNVNQGLFGVAGYREGAGSAATVQNVKINNVDIDCNGNNVGALIGDMYRTTVLNCHITGTISIICPNTSAQYNQMVGGLVGKGYTGSITNCSVIGDIEIKGGVCVGGLNGYGYADVTGCTVKDTSGDKGVIKSYAQVGGINGWTGENKVVISGCTVANLTLMTDDEFSGAITGTAQYGNIIENNTVTNVDISQSYNNSTSIGYVVGRNLGNVTEGATYVINNTVTDVTATNAGTAVTQLSGGNNNTYTIVAQTAVLDANGKVLTATGIEKMNSALLNENSEYDEETGTIKHYVAAIGSAKHETLQEAVTNASEGDTITLLADIELVASVTIGESQKITLELNGKRITGTGWSDEANGKHIYAIINKGSLTLKDTVGNGSITARGAVDNYGTMVMESGTVYTCDTNGGYGVWNRGTFTMNGGAIKTTHLTYTGSNDSNYMNQTTPTCLRNEEGAKATITGGTIESVNGAVYAVISVGTLEIIPAEGRTVTVSAPRGIAADGGTTLINGGTFTATEYAWWQKWYALYVDQNDATVTINGGTFNAEGHYSVCLGNSENAAATSTLTINGGIFQKPVEFRANNPETNINITGGKFLNWNPACATQHVIQEGVYLEQIYHNHNYVSEGKIGVLGQDGYYTLTDGSYVAKTDSACYETLDEALAAAEAAAAAADKIVTLAADITAGTVMVPAGVTLNLGAYTLTADYVVAFGFVTAESGAGKLAVAKDKIHLPTQCYNNGTYDILPIYNSEGGYYVFTWIDVRTTNSSTSTYQDRGLTVDTENNSLKFKFVVGVDDVAKGLLANGAADNNFSIVVRLTWTTTNGEAYQNFVYNEDAIKLVYGTGGNDFYLNLTGYDTVGIDPENLQVCGMVVTGSGAEAQGKICTAANPKGN